MGEQKVRIYHSNRRNNKMAKKVTGMIKLQL
ncbi:hypothetical protein Q604_UNBC10261G0002, partial [human gut metagenome]